jgi:hypothetical protein
MTIHRNDSSDKFVTTLGQLCFFRWCLTHNVLDYVEKNLSVISEDMKKTGTKLPDEGHLTEKKRRSSRRRSAIGLTATRVPCPPGTDSVIVTFN